ncbi:hypothetical protein [Nostoc sp. TCL26-01]|nr:hypothetical protein [Nostoc sp. TCL26-01]
MAIGQTFRDRFPRLTGYLDDWLAIASPLPGKLVWKALVVDV